MGPYAYRGNQWVGFDDIQTIREKVCDLFIHAVFFFIFEYLSQMIRKQFVL